jgi:hypothetical protein
MDIHVLPEELYTEGDVDEVTLLFQMQRRIGEQSSNEGGLIIM